MLMRWLPIWKTRHLSFHWANISWILADPKYKAKDMNGVQRALRTRWWWHLIGTGGSLCKSNHQTQSVPINTKPPHTHTHTWAQSCSKQSHCHRYSIYIHIYICRMPPDWYDIRLGNFPGMWVWLMSELVTFQHCWLWRQWLRYIICCASTAYRMRFGLVAWHTNDVRLRFAMWCQYVRRLPLQSFA